MRKVILLTEVECVFGFMKLLSEITPFDVEVFSASLGVRFFLHLIFCYNYVISFSQNGRIPLTFILAMIWALLIFLKKLVL